LTVIHVPYAGAIYEIFSLVLAIAMWSTDGSQVMPAIREHIKRKALSILFQFTLVASLSFHQTGHWQYTTSKSLIHRIALEVSSIPTHPILTKGTQSAAPSHRIKYALLITCCAIQGEFAFPPFFFLNMFTFMF